MGHKIMAIFKLSAKEIVVNMSMLTSLLLPIVMALMFQRIDEETGESIPFIIIFTMVGITFASATSSLIISMLAEDNEQGTLDYVMTDKKSMAANIIGRGVLLFAVTSLIMIFNLILMDSLTMMNFVDIIALIILWIIFYFLSAAFGMVSKTLAASSLFIIIMLFVFAMAPYLELMVTDQDNIFRRLFELTPLYQNLFIKEGMIARPFTILIIWAVISVIFFLIVFNRKVKSL